MNFTAAQKKSYDFLKDKWQRLNSLYYIIDEEANRVKFKCNDAQTKLFDEIWWLNIILKARQRGYTTFIDLFFLDECLFTPNLEAGIIAHKETDAVKIFRRKIRYPYDNLPDWLKDKRKLMTKRNDELKFPNESLIYVATSLRSGTVQLLHLSELGKICAKFPEKAREIITGSLPAIHAGAMCFIESTAEGKEGYFFDYCVDAQDVLKSGRALTRMDYKFHFSPWWDDPNNVLHEDYPVSDAWHSYFDGVESKISQEISIESRRWYVAKAKMMPDDMKKEYPATPEEAFEASAEGAYYATQFRHIRNERRICNVPYTEGIHVDTYWDLGHSDSTSIWFGQDVGKEVHLIDYYENSGEGLVHYAKILDEKAHEGGWVYGSHWGPHDIDVTELGPGKTRLKQALDLRDPVTGRKYCIRFSVAPKIEAEQDGWEAVRSILPICWFDDNKTSQKFGKKYVGVNSLENYKKEWNEKLQSYHNRPLHNWASHGSKAFECLAIAHGMTGKYGDLSKVFG